MGRHNRKLFEGLLRFIHFKLFSINCKWVWKQKVNEWSWTKSDFKQSKKING